jgi:7,8-dihydropterin-6-yl-methyl-4-(beta-D-ribofuranosyl)aminobenzene 5'-phosphate synthase
VLTGCGHAGIINIVSYARRITGVDTIYAVLGGFHLTGPLFELRIDATCPALQAIDPKSSFPPTAPAGGRGSRAVRRGR